MNSSNPWNITCCLCKGTRKIHSLDQSLFHQRRKGRKKLRGGESRSGLPITHRTGRARNAWLKELFPKGSSLENSHMSIPHPRVYFTSTREGTCKTAAVGLGYKTCPPNSSSVLLGGSAGDESSSGHLAGCCPLCGTR